MGKANAAAREAESEAAQAARRAEREAKLRERDALPMPSCITATSVYTENDPEPGAAGGDGAAGDGAAGDGAAGDGAAGDGAGGAEGDASAPSTRAMPPPPAPELSASTMAALASGAQGFSYTSGLQDGSGAARPNRFTSTAMAESHRKLLPGDDWFNVRPPEAPGAQ